MFAVRQHTRSRLGRLWPSTTTIEVTKREPQTKAYGTGVTPGGLSLQRLGVTRASDPPVHCGVWHSFSLIMLYESATPWLTTLRQTLALECFDGWGTELFERVAQTRC